MSRRWEEAEEITWETEGSPVSLWEMMVGVGAEPRSHSRAKRERVEAAWRDMEEDEASLFDRQ